MCGYSEVFPFVYCCGNSVQRWRESSGEVEGNPGNFYNL